MCRIFFNPSDSISFKSSDLEQFLKILENAGGRDGNGFYDFNGSNVKKFIPPNTSLNIKTPFLYHTRLGTNGKKALYNTQPIETDKYVLVHNGVYSNITGYARCLGFYWSDDKYSDSYMISYIIEKIGIIRFYTAMYDKSFGVVIVYDKANKRTYLLKKGGAFEGAKLKKSNKWIYASQSLKFWNIDDTTEIKFDDGLYLLMEDGYKTILKPKTTIRYVYGSRNSYWDYDYSDYYNPKPKNQEKNKSKKSKKHDKNYTKKEIARIKEKFMKDRVPSDLEVAVCMVCRKSLKQGRKFYNEGYIVCEECYDIYHEYECDEQFKEPEEETTSIWSLFKPKEDQKLLPSKNKNTCENCHYFDTPTGAEPCKSCYTDFGDSYEWNNWTPKGEGDSNVGHVPEKCYYCGTPFWDDEDDEIEPIYDKKGHRICGLCDDAELYIEDELQRYKRYQG